MSYVAVRVRGHAGVRGEIADTMSHLRLHKVNHAVIVPKNESYEGMLRKARDFIAYGDLTVEVLAQMLRTRGKVEGDKPLTDAYVAEHSGGKFRTIDDFVQAMGRGEASLKDVDGLKPVIRLNPPRKGYGGNKRHYPDGALGNWGDDINDLIQRMV